ncbi:type II toxin-antitoxin system PemK/MazF family toxin [Halopenitus sp. H-Gu1]|uniref:type II toxin-antitoxin system PemK/MazF family toxin n=1 Tax=Halopenitus sp. H-Gu1 TaxID=3242697 RepID=UPI00359EAEB7
MSDGPDVRRGDVVIVRFDPVEGHEMKKTRPAVVVQNDIGNRNSSATIVAPVTGTYREYPFEVFIEANGSPIEKDSSIHLDGATMADVDEALKLSLGLD